VSVKEVMPLAETMGYFVCSPGLDRGIADRLAAAVDEIFAEGLDRPLAAADGMDPAVYERVRPSPSPAARPAQ